MDVKELNETITKLNTRLRELSIEKLSRLIPVKRKAGDEKSRGFGISNYRDLLWLPVGILLYADGDYFMKRSTTQWTSTFSERTLTPKELFAVLVSLAADDFPIYFVYTPNIIEGA